jgi:heme-degrading monooxygenase HmoA
MITQDSFVVLTQLTYEPELRDRIIKLIYQSMPIFKRQDGLISVTAHHHAREPRTMTYFVWESEEDYNKCVSNPEFASVQSQWKEIVQSGKARFELDVYGVIDTYTGHAQTIF